MALVWQLNLKPHQKLILLAIADHANDDGYAWPGQQSLAKKVGVAERTVRHTVSQLAELGYLLIERPDPAGPNLYRVNPTGNQLPPPTGNPPPYPRQPAATTTGNPLPPNHKRTKMNQAAQLPMTYEQRPNSPDACSHRARDDTGYCAGCRTQL